MKTVAVVSQKGGVGKTTLATCLAVEESLNGGISTIVDMDPQATATFWHDTRSRDLPTIISIQGIRLRTTLDLLKDAGTDLAFVDGPAVGRDMTFSACELADFVLIPTKPSTFDLTSTMYAVEVARQVGRPYAVLLTFVPPRGRETRQARGLMEQLDANYYPRTITHRKAYYRAQERGLAVQEYEPKGVAASEIQRLYEFIKKQLGTNDEHR